MLRFVLVSVLTITAAAQQPIAGLRPFEFLVGEFEGRGKLANGTTYDETLTGEWSLGGTVLVIRSRSRVGEQTVYEDWRMITWDADKERARMRQFAMGDVATYDINVGDDAIVFDEVEHEGNARGLWRYRYTLRPTGGFDYVVDAKNADGTFSRQVGGELRKKAPDTRSQGKLAFANWRTSVPIDDRKSMKVIVHYPQGDGPFPVVVFSPGSGANTTQGYDTFGKWFASWGFVTVIAAFGGDAASRVDGYAKVADWLASQNDGDGKLQGKLAVKQLVAAGHSSGGHAAVLASRADPRFTSCLAITPAGPKSIDAGAHQPTTLVIVGTNDDLQSTGANMFEQLGGAKRLVTIDGMDHMFHPSSAYRNLLARATAFLAAEAGKRPEFAAQLDANVDGVTVRRKK